ncbi:hypothetical protein DXG01_006757, partial [Tephrocybe rancida]
DIGHPRARFLRLERERLAITNAPSLHPVGRIEPKIMDSEQNHKQIMPREVGTVVFVLQFMVHTIVVSRCSFPQVFDLTLLTGILYWSVPGQLWSSFPSILGLEFVSGGSIYYLPIVNVEYSVVHPQHSSQQTSGSLIHR